MLSTGRSPNPRSRTLCRFQWSPNCPQSHLLSPRMWHPWRGSRCMGRSNSWKSYSILLLSQLNIGNIGIHSLGSMSSMLDFGHVWSAWLCPLVLESKTYRWNGENDDHIRFLEVLWWLNHRSVTRGKSKNLGFSHNFSSIFIHFHPFFIHFSSMSTGAWQVVIQLDPLDTGAEAFALTAPLEPRSPERKRAMGNRWEQDPRHFHSWTSAEELWATAVENGSKTTPFP